MGAALWRYAKEQLLDKGEIGEVQWVFARLQGNRAMMFRWAPPPRHPSRTPVLARPRFHTGGSVPAVVAAGTGRM